MTLAERCTNMSASAAGVSREATAGDGVAVAGATRAVDVMKEGLKVCVEVPLAWSGAVEEGRRGSPCGRVTVGVGLPITPSFIMVVLRAVVA